VNFSLLVNFHIIIFHNMTGGELQFIIIHFCDVLEHVKQYLLSINTVKLRSFMSSREYKR
jgi:hypothetical protein